MRSSYERLNNGPKLNNESMDPAQLIKASAQPQEKNCLCYMCVIEESYLTMSVSTVYL